MSESRLLEAKDRALYTELDHMGEKELRCLVAEHLEYTDIIPGNSTTAPKGINPASSSGKHETIPCYPRFIAMAWTLLLMLQADGRNVAVWYHQDTKLWTAYSGKGYAFEGKEPEGCIVKLFLYIKGEK